MAVDQPEIGPAPGHQLGTNGGGEKAPDGDRFISIREPAPEPVVYDANFVDIKRSPDLIDIRVNSTVSNAQQQKRAVFRHKADELKRRLGARQEDVFVTLLFADRDGWPLGDGQPW